MDVFLLLKIIISPSKMTKFWRGFVNRLICVDILLSECPSGKWGLASNCSKDCPICLNGGICDDHSGLCVCAPGFSGPTCEQGMYVCKLIDLINNKHLLKRWYYLNLALSWKRTREEKLNNAHILTFLECTKRTRSFATFLNLL